MDKAQPTGRVFRKLWIGALGAMFAAAILLAIAQEFRITQIQVEDANTFTLTHEPDENSYFILYRGNEATDILEPVNMVLGPQSSGTLSDTNAPESGAFYRLLKVDLTQSLDTDGDGISDVYELAFSSVLNPLNGNDAGLDGDQDGITNLQEYRDRTDPTVVEEPLRVSIVDPPAESSFPAPIDFTLVADTFGPVEQVEFFSDGSKIGESTEVPFAMNWNDIGVGDYELTARATDADGNTAMSDPVPVTVNVPAPVITSNGDPTQESEIELLGTAVPDSEIRVVGGASTVTGQAQADGSFSVTVPLKSNRLNRLFATAVVNGRQSPQTSLEVIQDSQPPHLFIDFPSEEADLTTDTVVIAGRVGDMLSGFMGLNVEVNGQPANVVVGIGPNGTFERGNVSLQPGENAIEVQATDELGNSTTKSVTLNRISLSGRRLVPVSGDTQKTRIQQVLADPIVVQVLDGNDNPVPNKVVTFDVIRSNGRLSPTEQFDGDGRITLQQTTDANGRAAVYWRLGTDAGCGNNRVAVTSRDIAGSVYFCASADPEVAKQINVGSGNNQKVEAGGPAFEPLRVWVSDACNGVSDVPVTFRVVRGEGTVNGQSSVTIDSSMTGHAKVDFVLGPKAGNHIVEASFPNNPSEPARFNLFGLKRDPKQPTTMTGLVLNNANQPIGGARCVLEVEGELLPEVYSGDDGRFLITNVPPGAAHLHVDGLPATRLNGNTIPAGTFPALTYELTVVPNTENSLPTPVLLPPLNPENARVYDGTKDVILTVEGMEGLKMTVKAGSMRRADGSVPTPEDPAVLSLNQVHHDDIPMPMPDGAAPPFAWTLQPAGATFDPPVKIQYPNMSGLPIGAVAYFLSFNHDTEEFEIVATGHVIDDGSCIVTDPGVGLVVAGWGCNCPPYSVTGDCEGKGGGGGGGSSFALNGGGRITGNPFVRPPNKETLISSVSASSLNQAQAANSPAARMDTDGDGVTDYDEQRLFQTDPQVNDSDGDGYSDREEIASRFTSPRVAEPTDWRSWLRLPGSAAEPLRGEWETDGREIHSTGLRGELRYAFEVPGAAGFHMHRIRVEAGRHQDAIHVHDEPFVLRAYLDGEYLGKQSHRIELTGALAEFEFLTPFLPAGSHELILRWENVHEKRALAIRSVQFEGPGRTADEAFAAWEEGRLGRMAGLESAPRQSVVSPVCLEGPVVYPRLMSFDAADPVNVKAGAGERWYADLPLSPDQPTEYRISFQNGAKEVVRSVEWTPLNVLKTGATSVRVGDALKLAGQSDRSIAGKVFITVGNETFRTVPTQSIIHRFEEPGQVPVSVRYVHADGSVERNTIQVTVVARVNAPAAPVLWRDRPRDWTWQGLPDAAVVEHTGIELEETMRSQQGRTFRLLRRDVGPDRSLVARLGPDGPILGSVLTEAFWLRSVVDGFLKTEWLEDGTLTAENRIYTSDLPEDVQVEIKVINSGVVLEDGSMRRTLLDEDFDAAGRYAFQLFKPKEVMGSVCHQIRAYQNDQLIGKR